MGDNDSLYQTKNPLPLLQLKTFTTGHIWHWDVSEILQMNLHEIHPEFVKQKTFNICTNTTMPKISEIKENCRAVEPSLTPHTHQPPTISILALTLPAWWKCFLFCLTLAFSQSFILSEIILHQFQSLQQCLQSQSAALRCRCAPPRRSVDAAVQSTFHCVCVKVGQIKHTFYQCQRANQGNQYI